MRSKCLSCLFHSRKRRKMGLHTVSYPASRQDSPALERNFIGPHPPGDLSTSSYIWERFSRHGHDGQFRRKPFNSDILEHLLRNSNTKVPLEAVVSEIIALCPLFCLCFCLLACFNLMEPSSKKPSMLHALVHRGVPSSINRSTSVGLRP